MDLVQGTVLESDQGLGPGPAPGPGPGPGLVLGLVHGLDPGWEFDQESGAERELDKYPVSQEFLGYDQVYARLRCHQGSECTVSDTLLFHESGTFQGWTHPTSSVHCHSSTAFWSTAGSFGWRSAHSAG